MSLDHIVSRAEKISYAARFGECPDCDTAMDVRTTLPQRTPFMGFAKATRGKWLLCNECGLRAFRKDTDG